MGEVNERILPGQQMPAVIEHLERDPTRMVEGEDALKAWLQGLIDSTIADLDGTHFDIPEPLRRCEAMIAPPGGAAAMYYTGPSEDLSRPGRTWYPTQGRTQFPLWGEVSICYHEAVPGHHLQVGMMRYRRDRLDRFQRTMAWNAGHGEGWALYAERLMGELGYLDDPAFELGMLRAQAMRAVRVVVDIGLHLELAIPKGEDFHPGETWFAHRHPPVRVLVPNAGRSHRRGSGDAVERLVHRVHVLLHEQHSAEGRRHPSLWLPRGAHAHAERLHRKRDGGEEGEGPDHR
jgi:hypothetical protein